jgi:hypothetical protein
MELLTDIEHELIIKLGECANIFCNQIAWADVEDDKNEFIDKIHQLQHTVLAQAGARAYPDRYRLAGRTIS